ncbi:MAG: glycerol-3-phosphate acyltransferase, partial [Parasphingorhabdus sp.]
MDEATQIAISGPLLAQGPKLFVIDARNRVERRHLLDWLHTSMAEGGPGGKLNWVSLPISNERAVTRLGPLAEKLKENPDTLVVPVRIAWRIPNFEKSRAVKMRHVIFGDPRNPGSFRARSILLRNKRRAHCLTGQPATIDELKLRFAEISKDYDQTDNSEFAAFVVRQAGLVLDIAERGLRGRRYKVPRQVAGGLRS